VVRPLIDQALGRPPVESELAQNQAFKNESISEQSEQTERNRAHPPARMRPHRSEENLPPRGHSLLALGPRMTLLDQQNQPVFGPLRQGTAILQHTIFVDGKPVGSLLAPLPKFFMEKPTLDFVHTQLMNIVILAFCLILLATLVSIWLGKHLIKPIAGLRKATQEIASGRLHARVTKMHQDEIGNLAQHINSMASNLEIHDQKRKK